MEVMEAKERLPEETKGKNKENNPALDEGQSMLNKEEAEEEDFLQPYLHLLPPSLIELLWLCEITRVRNTYLTREVVLLEKHITELQGASGAVVQDDKGNVIAVANLFISHVRDDDAAELFPIRNNIYLISSIGCTKAEVESDCSFVMESMQLLNNYMRPDSAVITECKQLYIDFAKLSFDHCSRRQTRYLMS
ncbi:Bidirectional sugar transporter SWEET14 [Hordeum vulgare]|nr:Bidirectional sugar transporter SWEET14 [Hordeum vulgare]